METVASSLWSSISCQYPGAQIIALGRANRNLIWWLPWSLFRLAVELSKGRVRVVMAGDALMNALARPLLRIFRVPGIVMVHGLDISYTNRMYRSVVLPALRASPKVLTNSRATAELAIGNGVAPERVSVVRLAVEATATSSAQRINMRHEVGLMLGASEESLFLITVGRLVERKGVRWFVQEVIPQLSPKVVYGVAGTGSGKETEAIRQAAIDAGVADRVHLLGGVTDREREVLLCGADIFIQSNIPIAGDPEGFGLVAVEAAVRGTPVLAADLEGLRDAVTDGQTGMLLTPGNPEVWIEAIRGLELDRQVVSDMGYRASANATLLYSRKAMDASVIAALTFE